MDVIGSDMGEKQETNVEAWPLVFGFVTLVIVLAKMHGQIEVLQDKVKTLFDLWNSRPK